MVYMYVFIFKIVRRILPEQLHDRVEIVGDTTESQTRQSENTISQNKK